MNFLKTHQDIREPVLIVKKKNKMEALIKKLRKLKDRWEDVANNSWSDNYADAMWNCINDLGDILDNEPTTQT